MFSLYKKFCIIKKINFLGVTQKNKVAKPNYPSNGHSRYIIDLANYVDTNTTNMDELKAWLECHIESYKHHKKLQLATNVILQNNTRQNRGK